jgi:hypothetical protein
VTAWWRLAGAVLLVAIIAACQEELTEPADCPALCPGGAQRVFDTIVPALALQDSSYPRVIDPPGGYVDRGKGAALLVSNGFVASEDRTVYRFAARGDSLALRDTLRAYTVDSAAIVLNLVARDTLVNNLKVILYRLPSPETIDSTRTFADIDAQLVDSNLIDTIPVPDSVNVGTISAKLAGADLARLGLVPGGDSTLAIGIRIAADSPTGARLGSLGGGTAPAFTSFVTLLDVPDTGATLKPSISRGTVFNTFVTQNPIQRDDTLLTVGGEPSSRALVRFGLPREFLDSVTVIRATLELTPAHTIIGLPTDPATLQATGVISDLGAKSALAIPPVGSVIKQDTLPTVVNDTVEIEVTPHVRLWQSSSLRPQSIFLSLLPEAATFTRAVFFSTRSHVPDGTNVAPRLRLTYQRPFRFENQ